MNEEIVTIEVDGRPLQARKGQMLIEVTDKNKIYIPRFCYHQKLSIAANCRMCLVDVEKALKPLPACATPVMDGMKVATRSKRALDAQKAVMEFLLINHPLDCPICDQGGECELQDLAMGYGRDISRYHEKKRVVKDKNIGPLVQTDMTRCIHCTRCVRFGEEIAGLRELGATGRGEHMEIGTYIEKSMVSEMSGNVIDLCPVGALTSKPFRYSARTWEMQQVPGIAPHDSVGSNIHFHIKGNRVKRVVPAENESINEVWLSDRDRFSYEGLYHPDRLTAPMIKKSGYWQEVDWETALSFVRDGLKHVMHHHSSDQLGALASATATVEELYLMQRLLRSLGSANIDHRVRQSDFTDQDKAPLFPWLGMPIAELEKQDAVLLVGSHVRKEQPIINHRLRKATMRGCQVLVINPVNYDLNFNVATQIITSPNAIPETLAGVVKALADSGKISPDPDIKAAISTATVSDNQRLMAETLLTVGKGVILLGNQAMAHPQYVALCSLATALAKATGCHIGFLSDAANVSGAWIAGATPHRGPGGKAADKKGLNAAAMLENELKAYVLLGLEPELDCLDGHQAMQALQAAEFVVNLTAYSSESIKAYADVLLPIAQFAETSGTYINNEGIWQSFNGVVPPPGEARPAWKVLRVLGNLFELEGFEFNTSLEVKEELKNQIGLKSVSNMINWSTPHLRAANGGIERITEVPMNSIDPLTRHAAALQKTTDVADGKLHIHPQLASAQGLDEGQTARVEQDEQVVELPVILDERVPENAVLIQAGHPDVASLGPWHGQIKLGKA